MGSNMKLAAQRLIKIADDLEREAAENTFFVCEGCNHTASLADINKKRKVASSSYKVKRTANVTVNDAVTCLACGDKMSYVPTDSSEKFYVEAENTEDTGADIFEPVDERDSENTSDAPESDTPESDTPETPAVDEASPETPAAPENDMPPAVDESAPDTSDTEKTPDEDTSGIADYDGNPDEAEKPEDSEMSIGDAPAPEGDAPAPEGDTPAPEGDAPGGEDDPVVEETVGEGAPEDTGEEVPTEDEVSTDDPETTDEENIEAEIPKEDVPKFEKIPKDAQDAFWRSVAKYSV